MATKCVALARFVAYIRAVLHVPELHVARRCSVNFWLRLGATLSLAMAALPFPLPSRHVGAEKSGPHNQAGKLQCLFGFLISAAALLWPPWSANLGKFANTLRTFSSPIKPLSK